MPKLQDYRETYYIYTDKLSQLIRTLSFSAIGIIWIFGFEEKEAIINSWSILSLSYIVLSLISDLLQYIWASSIWGHYIKKLENKCLNEKREFYAPEWYNKPTNAFFKLKLIYMLLGYVALLGFLYELIVKS